MIDFIAYLQAQRQTLDGANSARPDAPVRPVTPREGRVSLRVRRRASLVLYWLASRVAPAPGLDREGAPAVEAS